MRRTAVVLILLALAIPAGASALEPYEVAKYDCKGRHGAPTTEKLVIDANFSEQKIRDFLRTNTLCPNSCYDVAIYFDKTKPDATVSVRGIMRCKEGDNADPKDEKRGCASGDTAPFVTTYVSAKETKQVGPKSRCDTKAITEAVDSMAKGDTDSALATLDRLANPPLPGPDALGDVSGNESLVNAFKAQGYTEAQANEIVAKNPQEAERYIDAIATNDKAAIAASAQKLGLNPNITDAQQKAVLKAIEESLPEEEREEWLGHIPFGTDNTFTGSIQDDREKARCALSSIESGSCDGNYGAIGPQTKKGGHAYGRYQVMDFNIPNWTRNACGRAMTPYQYLASSDCQDKVFDTYFMQHVATCGSYAGAASMWHSGKCNPGDSHDGGISTSGYVGKFMDSFNGGTKSFGAGVNSYAMGNSPFAQVNPFGDGSGGVGGYSQEDIVCDGSGACYLRQGAVPQGFQAPPAAPTTTGGGGAPSGGASGGTNTGTRGGSTSGGGQNRPVVQPIVPRTLPGSAVANLSVQPKEVTKGSSVSIAWSSAGVEEKPSCIVKMATSTSVTLAESNGGSRTVKLDYAGTHTFSIQCTAPGGTVVEKKETVLVK